MLSVIFFSLAAAAQDYTVLVEMRDGVHLATDVFLPEGDGPWPAVLYRTPYGRERLVGWEDRYTPYGVAWVVQDQRGRFDSEGEDMVLGADGDGVLSDGYDTAAWLVEQPWSNGIIATTGNSADGNVQYMQTPAQPPGLVFVNPEYSTSNFYQDAIFWGGVFRENLARTWLEGNDSLQFLDVIAAHPYVDAYWDSYQTWDQYGDVTAAGLHVGGWFDIFSQGNLDAFMGYQHEGGDGARGRQKLIMGPWTHTSIGVGNSGVASREQGELIFPVSSTDSPYPYEEVRNALLIHYLQLDLEADAPEDIPAVQYYVMGDVDDHSAPGNEWRIADDWPPEAAPVRMHFQAGGSLAEDCPSADGGVSTYVYDPADPSPSICGNNMNMDNGPCDQSAVEARDDIVVFTTPVLDEPMEITGHVRAHLFIDIDQPDTDLMVRLTDVYPDGRSMLILDGAARVAFRDDMTGLVPYAGETVEKVVDLWSTSIIINAGHRLRVSVTSSNYPRFAASRNTLEDWPDNTQGEGEPVLVTVHHSADHASYIEIPSPDRDDYTSCDVSAEVDTGGDEVPVSKGGCGCSSSAPERPGFFLLAPLLSLCVLGVRSRR